MASFDIDSDLIRRLADLLKETGLTEIEFAEGDKRLRIHRAVVAQAAVAAPAPAPVVVSSVKPVGAALPAGTVTSPMVGTAYVGPEPGGVPFARVGETVKVGQTLLIIEAMKVMNPIKAPRNGVVTEVLVSDAQPVEYGEPLLVIE